MKKGLICILVCTLMVVSTVVPIAATTESKKTSHPLTMGNTLYVGGSGPGNYTKIQDAIDNASNGDTVFVYDDSAPYYENVVVNKAINLIGENRNTTIIDGNLLESVMEITESSIFISSFTLRNGSGNGQAGIQLYNNNNVTIANCIIGYNVDGITSQHWVNNLSIINCVIHNNSGDGIYLFNFNDDSPQNCFLTNKGINKINSNINGWQSNATISNISIKDCIINCNTLNGIKIGVARDVEIHHNIISNNHGRGIMLWADTYDASIDNNTIFYNGAGGTYDGGILIQSCKNCYIKNNNISSNDKYGILFHKSPKNRFIENTFKENSINAFFNHYNNFWYGNYWDKPRLLPKLIFGRIGMFDFIPWINIDWHPAQEPYDIPLQEG